MSIPSFWHDTKWQELVRSTHQEMMNENALYEELSDESEMTDEQWGEYFKYHRGLDEDNKQE